MIRDLRHYCLIPLTPIHIGDGSELDPTQYVIRGNRLERFDPVTTIAALGERDKRDYLLALNKGDLSRAQRILQEAASRGENAMVALLSDRSKEELTQALENPNRRGSFKTMIRSGGRALIPGSTVKGALRTGFLHLETERRRIRPDQVERLIDGPDRSGRASDELQRLAFAVSAGATERDPMRDVAVADAALDQNSTQIDQVIDWKRGRDGDFAVPDQSYQIHAERLLSLADQSTEEIAPVSITLAVTAAQALSRRRAMERGHERSGPENSPDLATLLRGANAHHIAVWQGERQRFFPGLSGQPTARLLDACLARLGMADLDALARDEAPRRALIRLGWAGHFEAKSIAAVRRGYRPQARTEKTAKFGSTRHGILLNGVFVPFGWAALVPQEDAPAILPATTPAAATRSRASTTTSPAAAPRAPAASGSLLFRRGDRVRNEAGEIGIVSSDVKVGESTMMIEIDGDREPVRVMEWKKI